MAAAPIHITEEAQLADVVKDIVSKLVPGDVLLLEGNLGSGKTTFTQNLARALGITEPVTSPTFTIIGEYEIPADKKLKWLIHIDLYRIPEDQHGVDKEYIAEIIDTAKEHKRIVAIEWPEHLGLTLDRAWHISFEYGNEPTERIITINEPAS